MYKSFVVCSLIGLILSLACYCGCIEAYLRNIGADLLEMHNTQLYSIEEIKDLNYSLDTQVAQRDKAFEKILNRCDTRDKVYQLQEKRVKGYRRIIEKFTDTIQNQAKLVDDLRKAVKNAHAINVRKQEENKSLQAVIGEAAKRIDELDKELRMYKGSVYVPTSTRSGN